MAKVFALSTFSTAVIAAMSIMDNANASFIRTLTDEDSGSTDFDSSSFDRSSDSLDGSGSQEGMYTDESPSEVADAVPKFGQCGGIGYIGNSECARGFVCVLSNPWYAQCLPKGSQTSFPTKKHSHQSKIAKLPAADLLVEDAIKDVDDVVEAWGQCGGKDTDVDDTFKKPCEEGYTCEVVNEWYYQCQPQADLRDIKLWGQCGGEDYKGRKKCNTGSVCKHFNSWYSQCVPKEKEFS